MGADLNLHQWNRIYCFYIQVLQNVPRVTPVA